MGRWSHGEIQKLEQTPRCCSQSMNQIAATRRAEKDRLDALKTKACFGKLQCHDRALANQSCGRPALTRATFFRSWTLQETATSGTFCHCPWLAFTDFSIEGPLWRHDEVSLMAYAFDPQLTGQQLFDSTWWNLCFCCTFALFCEVRRPVSSFRPPRLRHGGLGRQS